MTPDAIYNAALGRASLSSGSSTFRERARLYLNMSIAEMVNMAAWAWLWKTTTITTEASTRTYDLASDVQTPQWFYDETNDAWIEWASADRVREADPDGDLTGTPYWVAMAGRDATTGYWSVDLFPTPDAALTVRYRYYAFVAEQTADTDATDLGPTIPAWLQPSLVHGTAMLLLQEKGDDESAAREKLLRDEAWQRALLRNQPDGATQIRIGGEGVESLFRASTKVTGY